MAEGPQHLSSAREMQSCGQTFIVTPMTSQPSFCRSDAATLESTPPLIPSKTLLPLPFMRVQYTGLPWGVKQGEREVYSAVTLGDLLFSVAGDFFEQLDDTVIHPKIDDFPLVAGSIKIKPPAQREILIQ